MSVVITHYTPIMVNLSELNRITPWTLYCGLGTVLLTVAVVFSVCLCQGKDFNLNLETWLNAIVIIEEFEQTQICKY